MSRREHIVLRALAVGILVSVQLVPHYAQRGADKIAQQDQQDLRTQDQRTQDQRMAEESGSAAGAGTASTVLAVTP